jgi:guanine deaminase
LIAHDLFKKRGVRLAQHTNPLKEAPVSEHDFLRRAVALASDAVRGGSEPFGSLIVRAGTIIAEGTNATTHDPTAHAEIVAIRRACASLGTNDLSDCEMFTSCEPCPMCLGAIYWARLSRLTFACDRHDAARAGLMEDVALYDEVARPPEARRIPTVRHSLPEAAAALAAWMARSPPQG